KLRREHRTLRNRRQPRPAALDEAEPHAPALPRGMEAGAPPPFAPRGNNRIDLDAAKPASRQRLAHLFALPGEIRGLLPMLQLTAPAAAEMAAGRRLPFRARLQHLKHLGAM